MQRVRRGGGGEDVKGKEGGGGVRRKSGEKRVPLSPYFPLFPPPSPYLPLLLTMELLRSVLSLPTAPFHEHHVTAFVRQFARERGLSVTTDEFGNLIVRYRRGSKVKPVALVAHMDHPGFEVAAVKGSAVTLLALGDTRGEQAVGMHVRFFSDADPAPRGVGVIQAVKDSDPQSGRNRQVIASVHSPVAVGDFAMWDLAPFRYHSDYVYSRAIDDLAGCAALLSTLDALTRSRADADVYGVFTRAEEVGFVGATGLTQVEGVPKDVPIISIEMSKALPGAEQRKGVVVRLGDRAGLFEPTLTDFLLKIAREMSAHDSAFKFQARLMDGGTCEATAFNVAGYAASGVCLPLGNYHNQGAQGIAPEFIHADDYRMLVRFLMTLAENMHKFDRAAAHIKSRVLEHFRCHRDKLLATGTRRR
ncbi:MAG: M28 family peptidase [Abditibacteriales bacterium]|nr:M28 family peptidase [Abditibacteriales bacterium]